MKTYQSHLKTTGAHGTQPIPNRKPVMKSSAIFPCIVRGELDTRILFMGYWLIKRGIPEISILRTLRDDGGSILFRQLQVVDDVRAFEISVRNILDEVDYAVDTFIGSIELEIFSTRDLMFPYPAFVLNYDSPAASTVVHTTGRIYNDFEDLKENDDIQVPEAGFDVLPREGVEPYFAFVNGTVACADARIRLELINSSQARMEKTLELGDLSPYQVCFVRFLEERDRAFLEGGKGTVILHHDLRGFFPRLIAGHMIESADVISLTHTFYDTTQHRTDDAYWHNADPDRFEDSTVAFPVQIGGNSYTEFVVYPNHAPTNMRFDLLLWDDEGRFVAKADNVFAIQAGEFKLTHIDIGDAFAADVNDNDRDRNYCAQVIIRADGPIPARLKFGLNLGTRDDLDLPSNICFNARVPDPAVLGKPSAFKWAPLRADSDSTLVLTNFSFERAYETSASVRLRFWGQNSGESIEREITIPPNGSYWFRLADHAQIVDKFGEKSGWVTCEADNPFMSGWYIFDAGRGVIGADHSF